MPRPKPRGPAELAKAHPLAQALVGAYLLNENGGLFKNRGICLQSPPSAGTNTDLTVGAAGATGSRPCDLGSGCAFDAVGYLTCGNPSQAYSGSGGSFGWSIATKFRINANPGGTAGVVSTGNASAVDSQPIYLLQLNGSTSIRVLVGNSAFQTILSSQATQTWYTVVSTFSRTLRESVAGTENHYLGVNGVSATLAVTASPTTGATVHGNSLYVGSGFNGKFAGDVEYCYLWDRPLTFREAMELVVDPYQMWEAGPWSSNVKAANEPIPKRLVMPTLYPFSGL